MKYRHGHWGGHAAAPARGELPASEMLDGRFELIIGSDLLYERDDDGTLSRTIARHAAPGAEVWIVDPDRGNRAAFHRQMPCWSTPRRPRSER
jgi:hypothetical protein